jgi:uncharacterized protein YegL
MSESHEEKDPTPQRELNPETRCPCVLLLDTSESMEGESIRELVAGIESLRKELLNDPLTSLRVEIAVVTFGEAVSVAQGLTSPEEFHLPPLKPAGKTPMATGVHKAFDLIEERLHHFRRHDLDHYKPWIVMVTDGKATDAPDVIASAAERIRRWEKEEQIAFFAIGVENADLEALSRIATRRPLKLRGLSFAGLFRWLSTSLTKVSRSRAGDRVELPNPLLEGWAEV